MEKLNHNQYNVWQILQSFKASLKREHRRLRAMIKHHSSTHCKWAAQHDLKKLEALSKANKRLMARIVKEKRYSLLNKIEACMKFFSLKEMLYDHEIMSYLEKP